MNRERIEEFLYREADLLDRPDLDSWMNLFAESGTYWASFDAGLTFLSSDTWQWDLSYGTGLNHRMNYTAVGFSWLVLPKR